MQGKRILGFARGASLDDLEFAGLVALYDPPRAGVRESVATLKTSGVRVRPRILLYFYNRVQGKEINLTVLNLTVFLMSPRCLYCTCHIN